MTSPFSTPAPFLSSCLHHPQAATRVLAKSLVRLRGQIAKLQGSSAQLTGIGTSITVGGEVIKRRKRRLLGG